MHALTRVHLEEDTGKLTHGAGGFSEVDLNRAGIPLMEIVSEPEIRSAPGCQGLPGRVAAHAPLSRRLRLRDAGGEPPLRRQRQRPHREGRRDDRHADRRDQEPEQLPAGRAGHPVRGRAAVRAVAKGRQDDQGRPQADPRLERPRGITKVQREKETAADYRYFPEPDLVPVVVDEAWIARVKASIGELPAARRKRFSGEYGLSDYDANVLVEQGQDVADYYDAVAKATGARTSSRATGSSRTSSGSSRSGRSRSASSPSARRPWPT